MKRSSAVAVFLAIGLAALVFSKLLSQGLIAPDQTTVAVPLSKLIVLKGATSPAAQQEFARTATDFAKRHGLQDADTSHPPMLEFSDGGHLRIVAMINNESYFTLFKEPNVTSDYRDVVRDAEETFAPLGFSPDASAPH